MAVVLTGFTVGFALFYEVGFVLMLPLVFTIAASARIPLLYVGVPMAAALSVTHASCRRIRVRPRSPPSSMPIWANAALRHHSGYPDGYPGGTGVCALPERDR
ncbi:High-affinity gluconate transporter GntT [Klebsiella pneumoniae]|uniref:High-affinity gluconate transporter GntT n=1 Tax=Klebsiella pneumoniae TaxID=573 RepID=A0A2X3BU12_KLEPN|nr:High-affinity gluconate transporter GntT [Klebsiella pneumoniae]